MKSENLCYEDLDRIDMLEINTSASGDIESGFGFEIFGKDALLRSVIVSPKYRAKGKGSELMKTVIYKANEAGIQNLYLLTTTASGFFEKFGFFRIERDAVPGTIAGTVEFATFCPDSAVCMKYEIELVI